MISKADANFRNILLKEALSASPYTYKAVRRKLWILPLSIEHYVVYYHDTPVRALRVHEGEVKAIVELMNNTYQIGRVDQLTVDEAMFDASRN